MSGGKAMQKILAIAWKDMLIRFSSKGEWLFFLVLPIVFTLVLAGGTGGPADSRIRLVVVDGAQTPLSAELIAGLDQSEAVRPDVQPASQADKLFSQRQVSAVLYIPTGFDSEHLRQGQLELDLHQQPNAPNALVDYQAVSAVISRMSSAVEIASRSAAEAERIRPFASEAAKTAYFDAAFAAAQSQLSQAPDRIVTVNGNTPEEIDYDPRANSSAGQLITWVFIPLIAISSMFAYERQKGTLRRLLTTPTEKATYLLGTITGQVLAALAQMLLLVGFGILVMGINWGRDPLGLAIMLVASALAAAALGTTLGTFVKTEGQASGLSVMLGMVMALLGGCWYPIELFPQVVRTAVKVLPTTWAMQGLLDLVLRGQGWVQILPVAGVLLAFALVFFGVGVMRFRYE
jgi:ABC-2 type transport system permease protein